MPISLSGRLWAKRIVETSQEAYDAVVLHAGSWDATYTAYNASGFEVGQRAEVHTWRGAFSLSEGPSHCQPVLRITKGRGSPEPALEAGVRPAFLLASCPNHDATLPRPRLPS